MYLRPMLLLTFSLVCLCPPPTLGQNQPKKKSPPSRPTPTVADFAYGRDSERQKLDFWRARSDKPTPLVLLIHGGGWMGGRAEFHVVRTEGSHKILAKTGHRLILSIPVHGNKPLKTGLLRSQIRKAGLTVEQFSALLNP